MEATIKLPIGYRSIEGFWEATGGLPYWTLELTPPNEYMWGKDLFTDRTKGGKPTADVINRPDHYTHGGIETFDYLKAKLTPEEYKGYLKGNALKYLSRAPYKGSEAQDHKKAQVYVNLLAELDI
jgi:hypothetical protein